MTENKLSPSSRTAEAEWIEERLAPWASAVTAIVPDGFEAYVRIFHPATGMDEQRFRWAEVATKSCRTMHRLAQFHAIHHLPVNDLASPVYEPEPGSLPADLLNALCGTLAAHTTGPQSCFFCLWDGWGWLYPDSSGSATVVFTPIGYEGPPPEIRASADSVPELLRRAVAAEARVRLPGRDYLLFEGPLEGATEIGSLIRQSPNLFWPEDRSWCVATEIDLYCTLVGGTKALADSLMANPALETWLVLPDDPISYDSDEINI